jgi:hypothetical protein
MLYPEAAYVAEFGSVSPTDVWVNKRLISVPSTNLPNHDVNQQQNTPYGDVVISSGKTCSGEWIDAVVFENWLATALQRNIYHLLMEKPKLPNTKAGLDEIRIKTEQVLLVAEQLGGISSRRRIWVEGTGRTAIINFRVQRTSAIHSTVIDGKLTF